MRCKVCEYRLWNLKEPRCPECGTPFRASEYEFVPNTVQFCCPHCEQAYYGTDEKGLPVPREFDCVSCGSHLHLDQMLLRPAEGIEDEQTEVRRVPWVQRKQIGLLRAWWRTAWMALVAPSRLMDTERLDREGRAAWSFAVANTLALVSVPLVVIGLWALIATLISGSAFPFIFAPVATIGFLVVAVVLTIPMIGLWGLLVHGLLRLTGRTAEGVGRTYQALCYSSGTTVVNLVPCCGMYFGWIWWIVSAALMLRGAQRVSGVRAAFATATVPVLLVGGLVTSYVLLMMWLVSTGPTAGTTAGWPAVGSAGSSGISQIQGAIGRYADDHLGRSPAHPAELVAGGYLQAGELVSPDSAMFDVTVPAVPAGTPRDSSSVSTDPAGQAVSGQPPAPMVAQRLGDYVFIDPGRPIARWTSGLWLVMEVPDPASNNPGSYTGMISVAWADGGTTQSFPSSMLPTELEAQNKLRAASGLPPLPDPWTITQDKPAIAPGPQAPPAEDPGQGQGF